MEYIFNVSMWGVVNNWSPFFIDFLKNMFVLWWVEANNVLTLTHDK